MQPPPRYSTKALRPAPNGKRAVSLLCAALACGLGSAFAQTPSPPPGTAATTAPASVPAGMDSPPPVVTLPRTVAQPDVPVKALHEAEAAYLRGARALDHKDLAAAEREFARAAELNPRNRDYALALAVTREHRLTDLVQRAAKAERLGRTAEAETLLQQARAIDPQNAIVRQHFLSDGQLMPLPGPAVPPDDPIRAMRAADARGIGGPIELAPEGGVRTFHTRGGPQEVLSAVCTAFGLKAQFDPSVAAGQIFRFDLENADYTEASRVAQTLTQTFAVPLQTKTAFFAKDTPENRTEYEPLVEETLFIPGATADSMTEYANLARNVFDLKTVTSVGSSGGLVLRGDAGTLDRVNATFADLIDGGSDVLLDLSLYEVDTTRTVNLGTSTPSSVGVFPVAAEAESLINANQSLISAAIASNQLVLTGNPYTDAIAELGLLLASGVVSSSQFSNLLGVFGHYSGLPLAGLFLGSGTTINALLNTSDVRILDTVQLRVGSGQDASFRAGTRYPIETGIYSSNVGNSLTSAVAGLNIGGTSVSSLLSQYLGSTSVAVPQIQFEDLGLTLKATPQVLRTNAVSMKLDFKIEALGSGTINSLPILNNRALTSQVTIPAGQTALLGSLVNRSEQRSIDGLPFLSELPGFQGTERTKEVDTTELLITLTPHVVRNRRMEIASRRVLMPVGSSRGAGSANGDEPLPQFVPGAGPSQGIPAPGTLPQGTLPQGPRTTTNPGQPLASPR